MLIISINLARLTNIEADLVCKKIISNNCVVIADMCMICDI